MPVNTAVTAVAVIRQLAERTSVRRCVSVIVSPRVFQSLGSIYKSLYAGRWLKVYADILST